jgi:hypothetical protein
VTHSDPNLLPTVALSYGGGWQSVAMCVLVKEGALPRPDLIGIADTSREIGSTWEYLYGVMQPYLDGIGLKIEVVPHTLARVDLYDAEGLTLMPAWTRTTEIVAGLFGDQEEHADGRLGSFCSGEWKRDVMERWLRLKGVKTCEQWIGYSLDETKRMSKAHREWCQPRYSLIEKRITREMCGRIITGAGLPLPKKSRCFMCPHQTPEEWMEVKERPDEWAAAVRIEKEVNANDPRQAGLFLYSGRVPLEMATFEKDAGLMPPARPCETGGCWT